MMTTATLYSVETSALPSYAARHATNILGVPTGAVQGGRLGTEIAVYGRDEANAIARELREHGYRAWVSSA
jgi:hypothetical protein